LNTVEYGTVDLASGEISEYKQLGYDKKNPFYLFGRTSAYKWDNFIYFFSETEKGDKMQLSKLDVSK